MTEQPLYDFAPLAWLLGVGVLLAVGPVAWVWWRHAGTGPARRLHALTVLTLFLTFDLTLFGAFTRLTDSGLGCPDWPGCYGNASPLGARHEIAMAQAAQPTGPVTHSKAWVEMVHRYLATGVGALIFVLAVATWIAQRRQRTSPVSHSQVSPRDSRPPPGASPPLRNSEPHAVGERGGVLSVWWPAATLVWVCLQGAFGALTVTWRLYPAIVTLHLLGAVVLLALLCIQAVRYRQTAEGRVPTAVPTGLRTLTWAATGLLLLQIALGGWVSTNYAVLACTQFPICQGSWWPPMNFSQAFEIWRQLGETKAGVPLEFAALTAIHYTHRLAAYLVFAVLGLLAVRLMRLPALRAQGRWLAGLALLQLATGLGNVLLGWPLIAAVLHTGGAAAMAVVLTWTLCETSPTPSRHALGAAASPPFAGVTPAAQQSTESPRGLLRGVARFRGVPAGETKA